MRMARRGEFIVRQAAAFCLEVPRLVRFYHPVPGRPDSAAQVIWREDPSAAVLERVRAAEPRARAASACRGDGPPLPPVPTASSGADEPGMAQVRVWARGMAAPGQTRGAYLGGYFEDGRSAAEWLCTLERRDGAWAVVERTCDVLWIS